MRALPEGDRAPRVPAVLPTDPELQMLPVADRAQITQLARGREQGHGRIAEAERRKLLELLRQLERKRQSARHDRIDRRGGRKLVLAQHRVRVLGEGARKHIHLRRINREPGRRAMAAPADEMVRAGGERLVQVEGSGRTARALPQLVAAGDQHDRPVVPLDEA